MVSSWLFALLYFLRYGLFLISYVSGQNHFPKPLSAAEEKEYLALARQGDKKARDVLVERNLRLVAHIVKKYNHVAGCDEDDLISIGTIGLMKAVNTFDYTKQARLATYAARCIENEILMTVRAGKKQKQEVSLNECLGHDADGNEVTFMDILASDEEDIADRIGTNDDIGKLALYMKKNLTPREMEIIIKRYGLGKRNYTQQEIAREMKISRSYVSRIEKKALGILSKCFEKE
ncbi:MAG: RNA polymerase sporulation sigma factor SigK [Clostridia bacterium]|nr:RNA polymerase sporulation sigma factor SigK [Clostridia bacterium]